jgi:hypothetical protein
LRREGVEVEEELGRTEERAVDREEDELLDEDEVETEGTFLSDAWVR